MHYPYPAELLQRTETSAGNARWLRLTFEYCSVAQPVVIRAAKTLLRYSARHHSRRRNRCVGLRAHRKQDRRYAAEVSQHWGQFGMRAVVVRKLRWRSLQAGSQTNNA